MDTKICRKCGVEKPLTEYTITDRKYGYRKARCKACESERVRAYYATNSSYRQETKERVRAWEKENPRSADTQWRYSLKFKFGITVKQYKEMLAKQGGGCALCADSDPGRNGKSGRHDGSKKWKSDRWNVDHDHKTGRVRGLLCHKCNVRLGAYEGLRDEIGMDKVREYLRE